MWPWLLVLGCLAALALGTYTLYLDYQVRARFEGARWELPAHVYASPLELYPGASVSQAALIGALQRLGYRDASHADNPGEYHASAGRIDLVVRPFTFWDGPQTARAIRVDFAGGAVKSIHNLQSGKSDPLVRLDPLLIGSIYPAHGQDRILVRLDDVPPLLIKGLIAVEDRRFWSHHGLDFRAIARALVADIKAGALVQGGSTLTQQLVKNFFLSNRRTLWRKFNEAIMAVLLEIHYSKREILQTYLNEVYLGQDGSRAIHGFGLASYFYFRRPLSELQPRQIALLIAMVKGPSYYDPRRHPKRTLARRDTVLGILRERGLLTQAQTIAAANRPLSVIKEAPETTTRYPDFIDLVRRQLHGQYRDSDLTSEGLRIFTTLNPSIQAIAETDVAKGLDRLEKNHRLPSDSLQAAVVVTSKEGGGVLALVGGRDAGYAGFNRALDARRQIGSLIKPAVYLTALRQPRNYTLVTQIPDTPITVDSGSDKPWRPQNYEHIFHGEVPLYRALAKSYNVATVHLGMQLGVAAVIDTLHKLGLEEDPSPLPSLLLGAVNLSPFQVAQIYSTIAGGGFHQPLLAIRSVTTKDGVPLQRYPMKLQQTLPSGPVYLLQWAMQQVMRIGTGRSAYAVIPPDIVLAGKTGTTNDLRDSWFAGFDGNRLAVVWVGRDDNATTHLTGAGGALRIWARVMADAGIRSLPVGAPAAVRLVPIAPGSWLRADGSCGDAISVPFLAGSAPDKPAPCAQNGVHRALDWLRGLFR